MLETFDKDPSYKLGKINQILRTKYGVEIDYSSPELEDSLYEMEDLKRNILAESHFNSYHANPHYVKLTLICEALRIYLKEIAPRRIRRKKHLGV